MAKNVLWKAWHDVVDKAGHPMSFNQQVSVK